MDCARASGATQSRNPKQTGSAAFPRIWRTLGTRAESGQRGQSEGGTLRRNAAPRHGLSPMTQRALVFSVAVFIGAGITPAFSGCSGSSGTTVDAGREPDAGGAPDAGLDSGVDAGPVDGPFGLDARPRNATCIAPAKPTVQSGVTIERVFTNVSFTAPALLAQPPGDSSRIWILERTGSIRHFPNDAGATPAQVQLALDIQSRVNLSGEGGLLGMAFHPAWASRKELYVSYTKTGSGGAPLRSVISRLKSTDNGESFDPSSEEVLLELDQPYTNHNGGGIGFGPDGFLYIGFGDGGSGGDPLQLGPAHQYAAREVRCASTSTSRWRRSTGSPRAIRTPRRARPATWLVRAHQHGHHALRGDLRARLPQSLALELRSRRRASCGSATSVRTRGRRSTGWCSAATTAGRSARARTASARPTAVRRRA